MTEIETTLLDELEKLEKERKQEIEVYESRLRAISAEYESNTQKLTKRYQDSLTSLMSSETDEDKALIVLLKSLSSQQKKIIELLKKPPKAEDTATKLKPILQDLFNTLENNLSASNKELMQPIEALSKALLEALKPSKKE